MKLSFILLIGLVQWYRRNIYLLTF